MELERYVGVYRSPGYPEVTLCAPSPPPPPSSSHSHTSSASHTHTTTDPQCISTLKTYSALENLTSSRNTLYFAFHGVWVSHGRLVYSPNDSEGEGDSESGGAGESVTESRGESESGDQRLGKEENGEVFKFTATYLFPEGFGKDKTPFESAVTPQTVGTVRFVVRAATSSGGGGGGAGVDGENGSGSGGGASTRGGEVLGFGLFGLVGEQTNREREGESVKERADVWFERVSGLV